MQTQLGNVSGLANTVNRGLLVANVNLCELLFTYVHMSVLKHMRL